MSAELAPRQETLPSIEPPPEAKPEPLQMLARALDRGMSVADLGPLMDLIERDQANKARSAFMEAVSRFQAKCPTIKKSRKADRYSYAPLDEILRTIRPLLDECGLAVRFSTTTSEHMITAVCHVSHRDGHVEESEFSAPVDENMKVNSTQKMGSANSYAKRYALMNALNLVASDEDDDGAGLNVERVTDEQARQLRDYIEATESDEVSFLRYFRVDCIENLPIAKYGSAIAMLRDKEKRQQSGGVE